MKFIYTKGEIDFADYHLVLPSSSYYYLDRHIIDVLIRRTSETTRAAYLIDENIAPFFGNVPQDHPVFEGHVTSAELFVCAPMKLAFLQLRSYFHCSNSYFAKILCKFIGKMKFKNITVVSCASHIFFDDVDQSIGALLLKSESKSEETIFVADDRISVRKIIFPCTDYEGYFPKLYRSGMAFEFMKRFPDCACLFGIFH
ncbi:hypothetical protein RF11_11455 [Thelohanellus kitauei]|uniref:Uncharacterized protein n=1 Tax=Thelohanellus kitauei TaxID=669202 RepID=A0A0C2MVU8_THEKT|nr:hypothetical protein RF11_11455 [Thelohanellus kitauei]